MSNTFLIQNKYEYYNDSEWLYNNMNKFQN